MAMNDEQICALMGITAKEPLEAYEVVMAPLRVIAEQSFDSGIAKGRAEVSMVFAMVRNELCFGGNWEDAKANIDRKLKEWGLG